MIETITNRKGTKANKIKGTALEFMCSKIFKEEKDCSIRKILKRYSKEQKDFYVFKKNYYFKKKNGEIRTYYKNTILTNEEFKTFLYNYISYSDFDEHIKKIDFSDKRIDIIFQKDNHIFLIECKNKEKTYFGSPDVYQTMIYPKILYKNKIYIDRLNFIYNGELRPISEQLITKYNKYGKTKIKFLKAEEFLRKKYKNKLIGCSYDCKNRKYKIILSPEEYLGNIKIIINEIEENETRTTT